MLHSARRSEIFERIVTVIPDGISESPNARTISTARAGLLGMHRLRRTGSRPDRLATGRFRDFPEHQSADPLVHDAERPLVGPPARPEQFAPRAGGRPVVRLCRS